MKVAGKFFRRSAAAAGTLQFALGAVALAGLCAQTPGVQGQAPYLLPYTIQVLAGGGTSVPVSYTAAGPLTTPCTGPGATGVQYDAYGDGCSITSTSVIAGAGSDLHDVVVDQQGNVYFLDNGSSNGVVRRIDGRSGIVTVYAGTYATTQSQCAAAYDKYGDGCTANDGKGNGGSNAGGSYVAEPYTGNLGKARGIGIGRNGDVYIADYSNSVVHKISAATGIMTVVAGSLATAAKATSNGGVKGYSGDGGLAFNSNANPPQGAAVNAPRGVTADAAGNVYIADSTNNVIRKVTAATGIINTIAGSATAGSSGDGGPATAALLTTPEDVEVDLNGNLFIGDFGNNKVRVIYEGGTAVARLISLTNNGATAQVGYIYTVVGGGTGTYTAPTQVLSTSVPIGNPRKLTLDGHGNIFIADNSYNIIWFVDITTGYMRPIAGTYGAAPVTAPLCSTKTDNFGDNCPAIDASFNANSAMGVTIDTAENLYIGDSGDQRLRKVYTNQTFPSTATGSAVTQTLLIHFAAGDSPASANSLVITGSTDFVAPATFACTTNPDTTQDCSIVITFTPSKPGIDTAVLTIKSTANGTASFGLSGAGNAAALALDPGTTASFASGLKTPQGIAEDAAGNVYIADTGNNRVLEYAAAGTPVVIAGTGTAGYTGDNGAATAATLNGPKAVAVARSGLIYIADTGNNVIRLLNPVTGTISTVAGGAGAVCSIANDTLGDGCLGTAATLKAPAGLAADSNGNVYIADSGNNLVRELTYSGYVFFVAGGASTVCATGDTFGNGCAPNAVAFSNPTGLQVDSSANLYIADTGDNEVRKFVPGTGTVIDIAGTGQAGASGNGGTATGAQLSGPTGVGIDAAGDVYIADTGNSVIRLVASGMINTVAGTLSANGAGTLPGSAFAVQLSSPSGVVSNGAGTLVILDGGNNRAFTDARGSVTYNFGRTNLGSASPTLQITETDTGSASATLGSPIFTPAPAAPFALGGTASNTCGSGTPLAPGVSCLLTASFTPSPTQLGSFSATYTEASNAINSPAPFISLSGVGAVLTMTTTTTVVTNPATGNPQYSVPFTVTTTVTPGSCNTAAPSCYPTGTVTFYVNGNQVGLPVTLSATGTASASISGLNVGTYPISAVYSGDLYYASSSETTLSVTVARGSTTTAVTLNPASAPQFTALSLSATVTAATSNIPTGTFTFYAAGVTTALGMAAVNARTGAGTLADTFVTAGIVTPAYYQNFGLNAGSYSITAVYSGDANYAPSTSPVGTLTITPDAATFTVSLNSPTAGTAQGSTAQLIATISANNTLNGTMGFTCTNLPANSTCTFGPPTTLSFTPVPGVPTLQTVNITIFTDVPSGVTQTTSKLDRPGNAPTLATLLGWPVLLASFAGMLGLRRRLRTNPLIARLFTVAALFGVLTGGSILMSGCSNANTSTQITPVGTYNINFVANGPGNVTVTTPITFTVGQGAAGQL